MINPKSETARIRAALVNTGKYTFEEADKKINNSSVSIYLGLNVAETPAGQAAFVTAVVDGLRCFGSVHVSGALETVYDLPIPLKGKTLEDVAVNLGASVNRAEHAKWVIIGDAPDLKDTWSVCPYWNGWIAGTSPPSNINRIGRGDCPLAGIVSGAMAIGQAFLSEQGDVRAGCINQCISIWAPHECPPDAANPEITDILLPSKIWFVGLGNLGQAYLWSLFSLPYAAPSDVLLFLQDDDLIDPENWGTSILVEKGRYGDLKTKIAEEWVERRGFQARRVDRRIDKHFRRYEHEPQIVISGLDKMEPRRVLGGAGFDCIIDCGLGATAQTYGSFGINVFDELTARSPQQHFEGVEDDVAKRTGSLMELPAYQNLGIEMNDGKCGAATLAGKSVAVPFVSGLAGALAIAQVIRIVSGELPNITIRGDAQDMNSLRAVLSESSERKFYDFTKVQSLG